MVQLLLDEGANINHPSTKYGNALHYACLNGDTEILQILLESGADVSTSNENHGTLAATISRDADRWLDRSNTKISCRSRTDFADREYDEASVLLLRYEKGLKIGERELLAAAQISNSQFRLLETLLEYDGTAKVTERVVVTAIRSHMAGDQMTTLFGRSGGIGVTESMLEAAYDQKILNLLLETRPVCELTPETLETVAR